MSITLKFSVLCSVILLFTINSLECLEEKFVIEQSNRLASNEKISEVLMYEIKPVDFKAVVEVAAIHIDAEGKLLILQLSSRKAEANTWGVPAGKIESGEQAFVAAKRELFEETGIKIGANDDVHEMAQLYFRKPDIDYVYHLFVLKFTKIPNVTLSDEHQDYKWVTEKEVAELNLLKGGKEAVEFYFQKARTN